MKCSLLQQALLSTMVNEMLCQTRLEMEVFRWHNKCIKYFIAFNFKFSVRLEQKKHVVSDNLFKVINNIFV